MTSRIPVTAEFKAKVQPATPVHADISHFPVKFTPRVPHNPVFHAGHVIDSPTSGYRDTNTGVNHMSSGVQGYNSGTV